MNPETERQTLMKRKLLLCALAVLIAGCDKTGQSTKGKVYSAIIARQQAIEANTRYFSGKKSKEDTGFPDAKAITQALRKVDVTLCPHQFQEAWLDYVDAWERRAEGYGLRSLAESAAGLATLNHSLSADALRTREKMDVDEAWRRVIRAATECGVTL